MTSDLSYKIRDGKVTLLKYTGADMTIIIPNTLEVLPIVELGEYCFQNCSFIESVTIPDSVQNIGSYCFADCTFIKSLLT